MWNVPLMVISNIKRILNKANLLESLPLDYAIWLNTLKGASFKEDETVHRLIDESLSLIKDRKKDFHIMNLEGLLKEEDESTNSTLSLKEKMEKVYLSKDFAIYSEQYNKDINKKKNLLIESIRYVSAMQQKNLIILKYRPEVTFYDLWNEFYMETRGLVIDIEKLQLVSTPYRKFFNLNENEETNLNKVAQLINNALDVTIKNKEDGSMISASECEGQCIVATPGSLESSQAQWARSYLKTNYINFYEHTPPNLTFIFEAIYPENRIVVDYKNQEKLILTNIRDKTTGRLLTEDRVSEYVDKYHFTIPLKETTTLEHLLVEATNTVKYPASDKEGWVFIIRTNQKDLLFKLKCDDYCKVHKIVGLATSPKVIFNHIKNETFDDFLVKVPETLKLLTSKIANIIQNAFLQEQSKVSEYLLSIPDDIKYSRNELLKYREFNTFVDMQIVPNLNSKLSKTTKQELEQAIRAKAYGKTIMLDKWTMEEFEKLWASIPEKFRDLKAFRTNQGKLLSFIKRNIPPKYQSFILSFMEDKPGHYFDLLKFKEINFDTVFESISNYQDN